MQFINEIKSKSELKYLISAVFLIASAAIYFKSSRVVSFGLTDPVPHRLSSLMIGFDIAAVIFIVYRIWRPMQANMPEINIKKDYEKIVRIRKIYIRIMTICPFMMVASFIGSYLLSYIVMTLVPVIFIISTCVFAGYFEDTIKDEDGEKVLELPDITLWAILGISILWSFHSGIILDRWSFPLFMTVLGIVIYIFINNKSVLENADVSWAFFALLFLVWVLHLLSGSIT